MGLADAVEHQVHAADAVHVLIGIYAIESFVREDALFGNIDQFGPLVIADVLRGTDQEACACSRETRSGSICHCCKAGGGKIQKTFKNISVLKNAIRL